MKSTTLILSFLSFIWVLGCSDTDKAKELLLQGKYQEVIDKYPDLEAAKSAYILIAETLLAHKEYKKIIEEYPNSPAYYRACPARANELLSEGKFETVLQEFDNSTYAEFARQAEDSLKLRKEDSLAMILYKKKEYREIILKYPHSSIATRTRQENPDITRQIEKERQQQEKEAAKVRGEQLLAERDRCLRNPNSCLRTGMRQFQVSAILGSPDDKNRTAFSVLGEQHLNEQWVYEVSPNSYKNVYLYFEDNILTSWQY